MQMVISTNSIQKIGAGISGAILVSPALHFSSTHPLRGIIAGTTVKFTFPLTQSLAGKKIQLSIFLYNKLGTSTPLLSTVTLPAQIPVR